MKKLFREPLGQIMFVVVALLFLRLLNLKRTGRYILRKFQHMPSVQSPPFE